MSREVCYAATLPPEIASDFVTLIGEAGEALAGRDCAAARDLYTAALALQPFSALRIFTAS